MMIRLTNDYKGQKAGTIIQVPFLSGRALITDGIGENANGPLSPPKPKPKKQPEPVHKVLEHTRQPEKIKLPEVKPVEAKPEVKPVKPEVKPMSAELPKVADIKK